MALNGEMNAATFNRAFQLGQRNIPNGFCATGDVMLRFCLFFACAAFSMKRASLGDGRYMVE